jgi:hypothetical protein
MGSLYSTAKVSPNQDVSEHEDVTTKKDTLQTNVRTDQKHQVKYKTSLIYGLKLDRTKMLKAFPPPDYGALWTAGLLMNPTKLQLFSGRDERLSSQIDHGKNETSKVSEQKSLCSGLTIKYTEHSTNKKKDEFGIWHKDFTILIGILVHEQLEESILVNMEQYEPPFSTKVYSPGIESIRARLWNYLETFPEFGKLDDCNYHVWHDDI